MLWLINIEIYSERILSTVTNNHRFFIFIDFMYGLNDVHNTFLSLRTLKLSLNLGTKLIN